MEIFERQFHATPQIFRAPGRVNLIGEHTDYNDGFVLPSANGYYTQVAISKRPDGKFVLWSTQFEQAFEANVTALPLSKLGTWWDYVLGVVVELIRSNVELKGR